MFEDDERNRCDQRIQHMVRSDRRYFARAERFVQMIKKFFKRQKVAEEIKVK